MIQTCANCARPLNPHGIILPIETEEATRAILLCEQCYSVFGTCNACAKAVPCAFDAYQGPKPKMIMRTIRQGNMVAQTQAPNPELVKELCFNCHCCEHEDELSNPICWRKTNGLCTKYEEVNLNGLLS